MAEKEYIERGALIAEYDRVHVGAPGGARMLMVEAPAADVVEVVRCKDCRHFCEIIGETCFCSHRYGLNGGIHRDSYCSYGRRKFESEKGAVNGSKKVPGENRED